MPWSAASVEERFDRLESLDEIRQLVAKYCLALDMRDLDAYRHSRIADPTAAVHCGDTRGGWPELPGTGHLACLVVSSL